MITTNYDNLIKEMAENELNEGTHSDYIDNYKWEIDFYLSNVNKMEYLEEIKEYFEITSLSLAILLRNKIIKEIMAYELAKMV